MEVKYIVCDLCPRIFGEDDPHNTRDNDSAFHKITVDFDDLPDGEITIDACVHCKDYLVDFIDQGLLWEALSIYKENYLSGKPFHFIDKKDVENIIPKESL